MEQTQENTGDKTPVYPKFIEDRLNMIPWEELEAGYGIKKEYIMSHEQIARQLANGQVTDYVKCYARNGNLVVIGPMALQATFRGDKAEVRHFTVNPNPDMNIYGEALKNNRIAERLMDTYESTVKDDEGNVVCKYSSHSYANGGSPITLTRKDADGNEVKTKYLVSFDGYVHNKNGEIFRGTQRLFITSCDEVRSYLDKVVPSMYGHEFTPEQKDALAEGKDLYIEDFKTKDGKTFDAVIQYSAVSRQIVKVNTPYWRETVRKRLEANKTSAPAPQKEEKKEEKKEDKQEGRKKESTRKVHRA